jgi:hypothetical protein
MDLASLFIVVGRWRHIGRDATGDAIIPKRSAVTGISYGGLPSLLGYSGRAPTYPFEHRTAA